MIIFKPGRLMFAIVVPLVELFLRLSLQPLDVLVVRVIAIKLLNIEADCARLSRAGVIGF
ncbi:hypothetical protein ACNKHK_12355 [Shigella flexneri]